MLENIDNWTPPDGLGYSSLRPVRLSGQGKAIVGVVAGMIIGAVVLVVFLSGKARHEAAEQRLLSTRGVVADAIVNRHWIASDEERQRWVEYRFEHGGRFYTHRVKVPRKFSQDLSAGSTVQVRFVPEKPSLSHPTAWDAQILAVWVAWVAPGMFVFPVILLLSLLQRQARLLAEGRPAPGRVTKLKRSDKGMVVYYEFRMLSGATVKGRSQTRKPPLEGALVCVLYDPEKPRRNSLYPLPLVRLENSR